MKTEDDSNMELYEAIAARRTIRDFEYAEIDDTVIGRILSAGMKAPTNDHMRDWHFIVVRDRETLLKLLNRIPAEVSDEEINAVLNNWNLVDSCQRELYKNAIPKQYRMLLEASCVIIPLLKQKTDILHPDNLSHLNGFASIWCCIENIFLASTAEGYACTLRIPLGDEAEYARETLNFPEDYFMPCFIGIGKPRADVPPVKQREYSLSEHIHDNIW